MYDILYNVLVYYFSPEDNKVSPATTTNYVGTCNFFITVTINWKPLRLDGLESANIILL